MRKVSNRIVLLTSLSIGHVGCAQSPEPELSGAYEAETRDAAAAAADAATEAALAVGGEGSYCGAVCAEEIEEESLLLCEAEKIWQEEQLATRCLAGEISVFREELSHSSRRLEERVLQYEAWDRHRLERYKLAALRRFVQADVSGKCNSQTIEMLRNQNDADIVLSYRENTEYVILHSQNVEKIVPCYPFE